MFRTTRAHLRLQEYARAKKRYVCLHEAIAEEKRLCGSVMVKLFIHSMAFKYEKGNHTSQCFRLLRYLHDAVTAHRKFDLAKASLLGTPNPGGSLIRSWLDRVFHTMDPTFGMKVSGLGLNPDPLNPKR